MSTTEVKVPNIGDYHDVPVIEVLVKDGDTVAREQPLLVLESDKATMEVPAPAAGRISELAVKVGDRVSEGTLVCRLQGEDAEPQAPSAGAAETRPAPGLAEKDRAPAADTALEVKIPDIGDYHDVPVIEVLVQPGDHVEKEQPLLVLESDKATMEVPAPAAGVIETFALKVGDKVSKGDSVGRLKSSAGAAAPAPQAQEPVPPPAAKPQPPAAPAPKAPEASTPQAASGAPGKLPYAGPATRKFARQLGVDLGLVKGSAARGRITIADVQAYVKQALKEPAAAAPSSAAAAGGLGIAPIPAVDFSAFGQTETRPLARIRKLSAAQLHRAWLNVPHVTQHDEADITDLEAFRKSQSDELSSSGGVKLTLLPFVMKACEKALKAFPDFNSSLSPDGASLIYKKYVHIGFAADTPNGLLVPVVRDVDAKGIVQLASECAELAKKAREGKLKPDEMRGGCFSISSLGGIGGGFFTPIVNAPEVAILGVSRGVMKPVWDGKGFAPRLMLPLSLSYDHRVIDGAAAARFIVLLTRLLGDLRRLTL